MSGDRPASPFWDFSLDIYGRPGVETACLALQDTHRLDVNLVLFAAWLATLGRRLPPSLADRARQLGEEYQARVMQPLREARRALRTCEVGGELEPLRADCRRSLLRIELDLEQLEQLQLERLAETAAPEAASAPARLFRANLTALYPDRALPSACLGQLAAELAATASPSADGASP